MKLIAATALGIVVLLLLPVGASAATVPNPDTLRAILPDPIDSSWIEASPGTSGFIDGPVDYDVIRAYYTYYKQSDSFIQHAIDILQSGGFVGGYERQWYRPTTTDLLTEQIQVFATRAGAASVLDTYKSEFARTEDFQGFFDPQLGGGAYGSMATVGTGYNFTNVDFARGNAEYAVTIGSEKPVKADDVTPQARLLFDRAPSSIALASALSPASVLARNFWLTAIAGLSLLLGIAVLVAAATVVLLLPHRRFVPPAGAQLRT